MVYIQVTRGAAPRKHPFPIPVIRPTVYLAAKPLAAQPAHYFDDGVAAISVPDTRWTRCDIKTICLLPNVLANQQAKEAGAFEALFVRDGALIEGSHANLFGVLDGELLTYPESNYILAGITRAAVITLARGAGFSVREAPIYWERIGDLEELFLTGTTTDVMPITELDGIPVADGRPGRHARRLLELLRDHMRSGEPSAVAAD
jgi:D-alanine transaminase